MSFPPSLHHHPPHYSLPEQHQKESWTVCHSLLQEVRQLQQQVLTLSTTAPPSSLHPPPPLPPHEDNPTPIPLGGKGNGEFASEDTSSGSRPHPHNKKWQAHYEEQIVRLTERIAASEDERHSQRRELDRYERRCQELTMLMEEHDARHGAMRRQLEESDAERQALRANAAEVTAERLLLQERHASLERTVQQCDAVSRELQAWVSVVEKERRDANDAVARLVAQDRRRQEQAEAQGRALAALQSVAAERDQLQQTVQVLEAQLAALKDVQQRQEQSFLETFRYAAAVQQVVEAATSGTSALEVELQESKEVIASLQAALLAATTATGPFVSLLSLANNAPTDNAEAEEQQQQPLAKEGEEAAHSVVSSSFHANAPDSPITSRDGCARCARLEANLLDAKLELSVANDITAALQTQLEAERQLQREPFRMALAEQERLALETLTQSHWKDVQQALESIVAHLQGNNNQSSSPHANNNKMDKKNDTEATDAGESLEALCERLTTELAKSRRLTAPITTAATGMGGGTSSRPHSNMNPPAPPSSFGLQQADPGWGTGSTTTTSASSSVVFSRPPPLPYTPQQQQLQHQQQTYPQQHRPHLIGNDAAPFTRQPPPLSMASATAPPTTAHPPHPHHPQHHPSPRPISLLHSEEVVEEREGLLLDHSMMLIQQYNSGNMNNNNNSGSSNPRASSAAAMTGNSPAAAAAASPSSGGQNTTKWNWGKNKRR